MSTILSTETNSGLSLFDTGTFEQMGLIASKLAASSLIPETLRTEKRNGKVVNLPAEQVAANCFRIVEQSQRWGMSPFAVIDCASVVYGKLMWEGKVIAAALEATMGIRLDYDYSGQGEGRAIVVSGRFPDEEKIRQVEGNVKNWKTDQWKATDYDQRLAYRGAREWARRHAPGVILGVYSSDEIAESEMVNVTRGRGQFVRDEVIEPGPVTEPTKAEELKEQAPDPNPEKVPAQGRQKKDRHQRDCVLKDLSEEQTESGKTCWRVVIDVGQTTAELRTFSSTMAERLGGLIGTPIRVTFTAGPRGTFELEDFEVIETQTTGGLI
jgi:hypothetical protein